MKLDEESRQLWEDLRRTQVPWTRGHFHRFPDIYIFGGKITLHSGSIPASPDDPAPTEGFWGKSIIERIQENQKKRNDFLKNLRNNINRLLGQ